MVGGLYLVSLTWLLLCSLFRGVVLGECRPNSQHGHRSLASMGLPIQSRVQNLVETGVVIQDSDDILVRASSGRHQTVV